MLLTNSTELFMIMVDVDAPSDENRGQATQAVQYEGQPSMHLIICF